MSFEFTLFLHTKIQKGFVEIKIYDIIGILKFRPDYLGDLRLNQIKKYQNN